MLGLNPILRSSRTAGDHESRRLSQKFRSLFEQIKVSHGLANQQLGLRAGSLPSKDRDEGSFAGHSVGANGFSGLGWRAFDIQKIVGDLESKTQIVSITA